LEQSTSVLTAFPPPQPSKFSRPDITPMACRFALIIVAGASATAQPQEPSGAVGAMSAPVFLQTQRTVERSVAGLNGVGAMEFPDGLVSPRLPSPVVAPPEAMQASHGLAAAEPRPVLAQMMGGSGQLSPEAWQSYLELKELRRTGFTCPGGTTFPPTNGELLFDCRLWKAAQLHSRDMGEREYFDDVTPEGRTPFDRSQAEGLGTHDENIAAGSADPSDMFWEWKVSLRGCLKMMDPAHNRVAVGYAKVASSQFTYYWTQLLASSTGSPDTSCYLPEGQVQTPPPSPASGGAADDCMDLDADCASWASECYCDPNSAYTCYTHRYCRRTCNLCNTTATTTSAPTGGEGCKDVSEHCAVWASVGYCSSESAYFGYMRGHCRKACSLCGGDRGFPPRESCDDVDDRCGSYKSLGYCSDGSRYWGWMKAKCARTCGLCS